jgi:hypothetical protein
MSLISWFTVRPHLRAFLMVVVKTCAAMVVKFVISKL